MTGHAFVPEIVTELAATLFPAAPVLDIVPLRGGLEASVARLTLGPPGEQRHVVVKRLAGGARREALRYQALASSGVTPSLLGAVDHADDTYLFLERVRPASSWPWRDPANTRLVLERLAHIHGLGDTAAHADPWNYDAELLRSGAETVAVAAEVAGSLPELDVRRELRTMRRVIMELPAARERMSLVLGTTLIHGDVHTRNVMLRNRRGRAEVVFLDWGRSRRGSPLEDVSSWLLSLRSWEPAAARDHDTLFRAYLAAAGHPAALTPEVRDAYWIAAASNVLAGALRYQLLVARESGGRTRATALAQAHAAFRVIRRAAERILKRGLPMTASILIIEHDRERRVLLEAAVRGESIAADSVETGEAALLRLGMHNYDCILLGSPVPVSFDGESAIMLDLFDRLAPNLASRLIVITHSGAADIIQRAMQMQVCAVFVAPFEMPELRETVHACVRGEELPRRLYGAMPEVERALRP